MFLVVNVMGSQIHDIYLQFLHEQFHFHMSCNSLCYNLFTKSICNMFLTCQKGQSRQKMFWCYYFFSPHSMQEILCERIDKFIQPNIFFFFYQVLKYIRERSKLKMVIFFHQQKVLPSQGSIKLWKYSGSVLSHHFSLFSVTYCVRGFFLKCLATYYYNTIAVWKR